jgi:hypothetical protein
MVLPSTRSRPRSSTGSARQNNPDHTTPPIPAALATNPLTAHVSHTMSIRFSASLSTSLIESMPGAVSQSPRPVSRHRSPNRTCNFHRIRLSTVSKGPCLTHRWVWAPCCHSDPHPKPHLHSKQRSVLGEEYDKPPQLPPLLGESHSASRVGSVDGLGGAKRPDVAGEAVAFRFGVSCRVRLPHRPTAESVNRANSGRFRRFKGFDSVLGAGDPPTRRGCLGGIVPYRDASPDRLTIRLRSRNQPH